MATTWTEDSIERWVERRTDQLDHQLMTHKLTQREYDHWMIDLTEFAERAYAEMARERPEEETMSPTIKRMKEAAELDHDLINSISAEIHRADAKIAEMENERPVGGIEEAIAHDRKLTLAYRHRSALGDKLLNASRLDVPFVYDEEKMFPFVGDPRRMTD